MKSTIENTICKLMGLRNRWNEFEKQNRGNKMMQLPEDYNLITSRLKDTEVEVKEVIIHI